MLLMLIRLVFIGMIVGAGLTGSPIFAAISLVPAALIFFIDGWQALLTYAVIAIVLLLLFGAIF